jgi:hypothetical protein
VLFHHFITLAKVLCTLDIYAGNVIILSYHRCLMFCVDERN